jgi:hypothetical protein
MWDLALVSPLTILRACARVSTSRDDTTGSHGGDHVEARAHAGDVTSGALLACSTARAPKTASVASSLVVCDSNPTPGAWICGDNLTIECAAAAATPLPPLVVRPVDANDAGAPACGDATFTAVPDSPLPLGVHTIIVTQESDAGTVEACRSIVRVVDTTPPTATTQETILWPPNHAMHRITLADCVDAHDTCDDQVAVRFTYVASDEPVDARGDGHSAPDVIAAGCDAVDLRSERQGGGDGRIYRLGWRAQDLSGNATDGECRVVITHDQSGRAAVSSGEAYRVPVCP